MDVVNRRCEFRGCTKTPTYGIAGQRAQFCPTHRLPNMEDVKNRRCEWLECRRHPVFGLEGERPRFCSAHRMEEMVNLRHRTCIKTSCSKPPTHGFPGERATACVDHAKPDMINHDAGKSGMGLRAKKDEAEIDTPPDGTRSTDTSPDEKERRPDYAERPKGILGDLSIGRPDGRSSKWSGRWSLGSSGRGGGSGLRQGAGASPRGHMQGEQGTLGESRGVSRVSLDGIKVGVAVPPGIPTRRGEPGFPWQLEHEAPRPMVPYPMPPYAAAGAGSRVPELEQKYVPVHHPVERLRRGHVSEGGHGSYPGGVDYGHSQPPSSWHRDQQIDLARRPRAGQHGHRVRSRQAEQHDPYGARASPSDKGVHCIPGPSVVGGRAILRPLQARPSAVRSPRSRRHLPQSPFGAIEDGVSRGDKTLAG